jgi:hypothetical protein
MAVCLGLGREPRARRFQRLFDVTKQVEGGSSDIASLLLSAAADPNASGILPQTSLSILILFNTKCDSQTTTTALH